MHSLLYFLAIRTGWFAEERFLGRLLDHWGADGEEFVRVKLPHLLVVAAIAFVLMRLLRLITFHMTRAAERNSATPVHIAQVKTVAGIVRTTGLAIIWVIAGLQILDTLGVNLAPLLASAGIAGIALGLAAQNIVKDVLNGILYRAIGTALMAVGVLLIVKVVMRVDRQHRRENITLTLRTKLLTVLLGAVAGLMIGLTSVGSGTFIGVFLILFYPLATDRIVGTDIFLDEPSVTGTPISQAMRTKSGAGYISFTGHRSPAVFTS